MSNFAQPGTTSGAIEWKALNGHLLMIEVLENVKDITTKYGLSDAIRANVTVLDGPLADTPYENTLVFPKVLQSQLRSLVGQTVLGRLGQGQAKGGQDPPWQLAVATDADQRLATEHVAKQATQAPAGVSPDDLLGDGSYRTSEIGHPGEGPF